MVFDSISHEDDTKVVIVGDLKSFMKAFCELHDCQAYLIQYKLLCLLNISYKWLYFIINKLP